VAKKPSTPPPPRPVQAPKRRDDPKTRKPLDKRLVWGGGAAVVVVAVVVVLAVVLGGGSGSSKPKQIDWAAVPNLQSGPPPWGPQSDQLPDRLAVVGLSQLPQEGTVIHIHQHLDLWVNGTKVTLPANIGIDQAGGFITELHVHQTEENYIHVESPVKKTFYLGQLFGEWGVRLTSRCVGSFCGKLSWWVDGKKQTGDPALLALKEHQEIAIALGKPPANVPSTYPSSGP
jgi:hypothetical protein